MKAGDVPLSRTGGGACVRRPAAAAVAVGVQCTLQQTGPRPPGLPAQPHRAAHQGDER